MKLYLLSQGVWRGYDSCDSMVVAAESEDAARQIHPAEEWDWLPEGTDFWSKPAGWADRPDQVDVEYLGEAVEGTEVGIILASFNAG